MKVNEYTIGTTAFVKHNIKCHIYERDDISFRGLPVPIWWERSSRTQTEYNSYSGPRATLPTGTMMTCVYPGMRGMARSVWLITDTKSEFYGKHVIIGYNYDLDTEDYFMEGIWARHLHQTNPLHCNKF